MPSASMYRFGLSPSDVLTILCAVLADPNDDFDSLGLGYETSFAVWVWAFAYDFGGRLIFCTGVSSIVRRSAVLSMTVYDGSGVFSKANIPDPVVDFEPGHVAGNCRQLSDSIELGVGDEVSELVAVGLRECGITEWSAHSMIIVDKERSNAQEGWIYISN